MSVIDEVKQKLDIVDIVSQYTKLTKSGRTFRGLCPFHSETRPSFFVYPEQQSWHCFGACNTGGDVFSFVMKKENLSFGEALQLLARQAGVTIPSRAEADTSREEKEKLHQINGAAAQYFHNLLLNSTAAEKARAYLKSRGFVAQSIADFQLGFSLNSWEALKQYLTERGYSESELLEAGLTVETEDGRTHDRFRNRLMFPLMDARGHVSGFGARVLDDSLPKYINSPQTRVFDKSGSLYGINLAAAAIKQSDQAVLVEGYIDVITAHQHGFRNVVAAMGTAITERQTGIIKRLTRNIVLALDADKAGEEASLRCVDYENSLNSEVRVVILPAGKDPDDVIKEDEKTWQHLLDEALPVMDYTFNLVTSQMDMTTARGKTRAAEKLLPIISKMQDIVRQAHYLQKLASLVRVSERNLQLSLRKLRQGERLRKQAPEEQPLAVNLSAHLSLSSPLEEDCLALLLQYPELKSQSEAILPEYFDNSENHEVFLAWRQANDLPALKGKLDPALHSYVDSLVSKSLPPLDALERYASYALRLREKYLRNLEAKRAEILALEVELAGTGADLAKLKEEGIETSIQLKEIFAQKARKAGGKGDEP